MNKQKYLKNLSNYNIFKISNYNNKLENDNKRGDYMYDEMLGYASHINCNIEHINSFMRQVMNIYNIIKNTEGFEKIDTNAKTYIILYCWIFDVIDIILPIKNLNRKMIDKILQEKMGDILDRRTEIISIDICEGVSSNKTSNILCNVKYDNKSKLTCIGNNILEIPNDTDNEYTVIANIKERQKVILCEDTYKLYTAKYEYKIGVHYDKNKKEDMINIKIGEINIYIIYKNIKKTILKKLTMRK